MSIDPYYGYYSSTPQQRKESPPSAGGAVGSSQVTPSPKQLVETQQALQKQAKPGETKTVSTSSGGYVKEQVIEEGKPTEKFVYHPKIKTTTYETLSPTQSYMLSYRGLNLSEPKERQFSLLIEKQVSEGKYETYQGKIERDLFLGNQIMTPAAAMTPMPIPDKPALTYNIIRPRETSPLVEAANVLIAKYGADRGYSYYHELKGTYKGEPWSYGMGGVAYAPPVKIMGGRITQPEIKTQAQIKAERKAFETKIKFGDYRLTPVSQPTPDTSYAYKVPESAFKEGEQLSDYFNYYAKTEFTGASELGYNLGGTVGGTLGSLGDIGIQTGQIFSREKGDIGFHPEYIGKTALQLGLTVPAVGGSLLLLARERSALPLWESYSFEKMPLYTPFQKEAFEFGASAYLTKKALDVTAKGARAGTRAGFEFREWVREKTDPAYIRSAEESPGVKLPKLFEPKEPAQVKVRDVVNLVSTKTELGNVQISVGMLDISQTFKLNPLRETAAQATGKGFVMEFEKPVGKAELIAELQKPRGLSANEIRQRELITKSLELDRAHLKELKEDFNPTTGKWKGHPKEWEKSVKLAERAVEEQTLQLKELQQKSLQKSQLAQDIKSYTGSDVAVAVEKIKGLSDERTYKAVGITFDLKGTGLDIRQRFSDWYYNKPKTTRVFKIEGGMEAFDLGEALEYNVAPEYVKRLQQVAPFFKEFVGKEKGFIEYSGALGEKGLVAKEIPNWKSYSEKYAYTIKGKEGLSHWVKTEPSEIYFHTHPEPRLRDYAGWAAKNYRWMFEKRLPSPVLKTAYPKSATPSVGDVIISQELEGSKPTVIFSKGGITYYDVSKTDFLKYSDFMQKWKYGKFPLEKLRELDIPASYIPYESVSKLGQKYYSTFGHYRVGGVTGFAASKSKLFLETPKAQVFSGITKFAEIGTGKSGKLRQIVTIEKSEALNEKMGGTSKRFIPNPDAGRAGTTQLASYGNAEQVMGALGQKSSAWMANYANLAEKSPFKVGSGLPAIPLMFKSSGKGISEEKGRQQPITVPLSLTTEKTIRGQVPIISPLSQYKTDTRGIQPYPPIIIEPTIYREDTRGIQPYPPIIIEPTIGKTTERFLSLQQPIITTKPKQFQIQRYRYYQPITGTVTPPPPEIPKIGFDNLADTKHEKKSKAIFGGLSKFRLFVRKKKKFVPMASGLTKSQAFAKGMELTERTVAASFKVRPENALQSEKAESFGNLDLFRKYYPKKEKGETIYIEKPRYRINVQGEVFGLKQAKQLKKLRWF